ncbi:uncharacterized protein TNCV_1408541 [Trichonephila clavipes]|uniref:BTB domain-containing protein n=1 Tax=Trichonephila clavipes TaxID=2585209 RepID=A0A8X6RA73_TRICX|nr:uncharacterized protein TNCV_1408541 [Trichonephila clavipes]
MRDIYINLDIRFNICKLKGALSPFLSWTVRFVEKGDINSKEIEKLSVKEEYRIEKEEITNNKRSLEINHNKCKNIVDKSPDSPGGRVKIQSKTAELTRQKLTNVERNSNEVENDETSLSRKSVNEILSTRFKNDIYFIKEIISYLMAKEELFVEEDSENDNKNEWYLNVETMDRVQFAIPFENSKETLGSKLVACSPVFEAMLQHPMQERSEKKVEIPDIHSQTFISFLKYLKSGDFIDESLSDVFDLYELADKYFIKTLINVCANTMVPYFLLENIDAVEMLANMHSDDYLLQLVEFFKNKNITSDVSHQKMCEASIVYRNPFKKNNKNITSNVSHQKIYEASNVYRIPFEKNESIMELCRHNMSILYELELPV